MTKQPIIHSEYLVPNEPIRKEEIRGIGSALQHYRDETKKNIITDSTLSFEVLHERKNQY